MRALTAEQKLALRSVATRVDRLVEVDLGLDDYGVPRIERYWSGSGVLDLDGEAWLGCGAIAEIRGVEASTDPSIYSVELLVSGLADDAVGYLEEDLKGHTAFVYDLQMSPAGRPIGGADLELEIALDNGSLLADGDGSFVAVLRGQAGFWTLEDPIERIWSGARIREDHPDETGLDLLPELEGKVVPWTKL